MNLLTWYPYMYIVSGVGWNWPSDAPERELPMFLVTKTFTAGLLAGLTITEQCPVCFIVGQTYRAIGGSDYRVTACVAIRH